MTLNWHILSVNDITNQRLEAILNKALSFEAGFSYAGKNGLSLVNLFFENSTRTSHSFEVAACKNGLNFYNFNAQSSSVAKGESIMDTFITIVQQNHSFIAARVPSALQMGLFADFVNKNNLKTCIINAGDGKNEHPTQAMGDLLTIMKHFKLTPKDVVNGGLKGLNIAIAGDVFNSRVARSNIYLLSRLGMGVRLVTNPLFYPKSLRDFYEQKYNATYHTSINKALAECDVVMALRFQTERFDKTQSQSCNFAINDSNIHLLQKHCAIMHPAPINSGFEITDEIANKHPNSLITQQVKSCTNVRSACLALAIEELF